MDSDSLSWYKADVARISYIFIFGLNVITDIFFYFYFIIWDWYEFFAHILAGYITFSKIAIVSTWSDI